MRRAVLPYYLFFLGLVYCIINPIIAPTALVYFLMAMGTQRYNALYVFKTSYESGGKIWGTAFHQFMAGLYAMQVGVRQARSSPSDLPFEYRGSLTL